MTKLKQVENALIAINEAIFQELCDNFLVLKHPEYKPFSRPGSQTGKQKTTKGTPDSIFVHPNGKYVFVEHSTNVTIKLKKLKDDVRKCLNPRKTNIFIDKIEKIIICINFTLNTQEKEELEGLLSQTKITLELYTLDCLALELNLHHQSLVREYLNLPIDTGQVVSIQKFIIEYEKATQGIATPLSNPFLHREQEVKELKSLLTQKNIVILCGPPGVGKTKLALETINVFIKENSTYNAFCISYKNADLIEDLYQNLNLAKDSILFVDDANRINHITQILGFYKTQRTGSLKILITVRDYAYDIVKNSCRELPFEQYSINKLTDEQVINLIKEEPFGILNSLYHRAIVRIADGNPRLAIMAALLAKEKQNPDALADVSNLFENYFSTFIHDESEFADPLNIKVLGIIAFFGAIPYRDREVAEPIFRNFEIDCYTVFERIERLERLELIEIQHDYVKVSEQNLSTYFFYKAFIKDGLLSFETLLDKYFDNKVNCFKDCVIPANNTFGYENVMGKLQPILQQYWGTIQHDAERNFKLLSVFWAYLPNETLAFVNHVIESLPKNDETSYETKYEPSDSAGKRNEIIELLSKLFHLHDDYLKNAIELSFEFVRKIPPVLPELIHQLKEKLVFTWEDERHGFVRQRTLFQLLINGLNKNDVLYSKAFFELSKIFLLFKHTHVTSERLRAMTWHDYSLPNNKSIREFRKDIWENINNHFSNDAFEVLRNYAQKDFDATKELMEYDLQFIIKIIETHLTPDSFEHCRYVQEQIRCYKRNAIIFPDSNELRSKFTNPLYEMSLKLKWNVFGAKEDYEVKDYREYEEMKEAEIRSHFVFENESEMRLFYKDFVCLYSIEDASNKRSYRNVLDLIIDENCNKNFELGCKLLTEVIRNNVTDYEPGIVFKNHLNTEEKVDYIWNRLQANEFEDKAIWELQFYYYIPESFVAKKYIPAIKNSVLNINEKKHIHLLGLKKFISTEPKLLEDLLHIIVERNETENKIGMWDFEELFELLEDNISLIQKAYIQQVEIQRFFDYEKKGFLKILAKNPRFLVEYVNGLYSTFATKSYLLETDDTLRVVWQIGNIELAMRDVFNLCAERANYGIGAHFCNSFFLNLQADVKERAKQFLLDYSKANYRDHNKTNLVIDIVRHSMKEFYEDVLLQFISLTQDVDLFSKIWWRGKGGIGGGDDSLGDMEATEWRNILSVVEKTDLGIKLIPIKRYIHSQIEDALKYADTERKMKFLERW